MTVPIASSDEWAPTTLPRAQRRRFDYQKWSAIAVHDPCVVLVAYDRELIVLLARNHTTSRNGERLQGLRLISIPNGRRLRLLEIKALCGRARLPDEWLFTKAAIHRSQGGHRLMIDGQVHTTNRNPFPVQALSGAELQRLSTCLGRVLRQQIVTIFKQHLPVGIIRHQPLTFHLPAFFPIRHLGAPEKKV